MRKIIAVPVVVVGLVVALSPVAQPQPTADAVSCNQTVTGLVVLTHDLVCTGTDSGLIVGADNTTILLAGHSITGDGCDDGESGIANTEGYDHFTVRGGAITDFCWGVKVDGGIDGGTNDVEVTRVAFVDNRMWVKVDDGLTVRHNSATGQTGDAFDIDSDTCDGNCVTGVVVEFNVATAVSGRGYRFEALRGGVVQFNKAIDGSSDGFSVNSGDGTVFAWNTATGNDSRGIRMSGSAGGNEYLSNFVAHNGSDGFRVFSPGGNHFAGNFVINNGGDGIEDSVSAGSTRYDRNVVINNSGYGILASNGVSPGDTNLVFGNGDGCSPGLSCLPQS